MLQLFRRLFRSRANPIGIDFGTDTLRLAQVQLDGNNFSLRAAATVPVPPEIRDDLQARSKFLAQTLPDLLAQGKFTGRRVVLGLPSAWTTVRHFRVTNADDQNIQATVAGDGPRQLTRHLIAGEILHGNQRQSEVIALAAPLDRVDALLKVVGDAGLDVVGLTVEALSMVHCFAHVYRRKTDANSTFCLLDLGSQSTRMVVARGGRVLFMRNIPIGGDHLNAIAGTALEMSRSDTALFRQKLTHSQASAGDPRSSLRLETDDMATRVHQAMVERLQQLANEIKQGRREHEATFPNAPIERLIVCGGEARNPAIRASIERIVNCPSQVGDPMVRLSKTSQVGMESGIDRRQPQPAWAVALGLTMGEAAVGEALPMSVTIAQPAAQTAREAA